MSTDIDIQNKILLEHFQAGGSITHVEAQEQFGITNLSGRVAELRQAGYDIGDVWERGENRYGKTVKWKRYALRTAAERRGTVKITDLIMAV